MTTVHFRLTSQELPHDALVLAFRGEERISAPSLVDLVFRLTGVDFDPDVLVGQPVSLAVEEVASPLAVARRTTLSGVVTSAELEGVEDGHALYRLSFSPRLSLLALARHSRVFTDKTIPEIVLDVLASEGIPASDVKLALSEDYESRAHVCQYRESSLAFISRLMEREGLYYFFEHDEGRDVLVICDDRAHAPALEQPVRFAPRAGSDGAAGGAFSSLVDERRALTGRVVFSDYDEAQPALALGSEVLVSERAWAPRYVSYGEHLESPARAAHLAKVFAQSLAATERTIEARGGVVGLRAGATLRFARAGALDLGAMGDEDARLAGLPEECLIVAIAHSGVQTAAPASALAALELSSGAPGYSSDAILIPADTQFRAPQRTPRPRVSGVEPALIDGPAESAYAQIDAHGRYKLRLLFDEGPALGAAPDGARSTWVRKLEPHAGAPDGFHFPLRRGTEVQIAFLGGDPDRPVIVGVAPNAEKPSAVTLSNNTRNVLRTGGDNLWELEDQAGAQRVLTRTPTAATHLHLGAGGHQLELRSDGQGLLHYGQDLDVSVGATKTEIVKSDLSETFRGTHQLDVAGATLATLKTSLTETVLGPVSNLWSDTLREVVAGFVSELYQAGLKTHAVGAADLTDDGALTLTVRGGIALERAKPTRNVTVSTTGTITVSGAVTEIYGATVRAVHGDLTETVTGAYTVKAAKMLVYANDATILDQGINALEKAVSWINGFIDAHIDDGTSIGVASLSAVGLGVTLAGRSTSSSQASATVAGIIVDVAALRVSFDITNLRMKGARMAVKGLFLIL